MFHIIILCLWIILLRCAVRKGDLYAIICAWNFFYFIMASTWQCLRKLSTGLKNVLHVHRFRWTVHWKCISYVTVRREMWCWRCWFHSVIHKKISLGCPLESQQRKMEESVQKPELNWTGKTPFCRDITNITLSFSFSFQMYILWHDVKKQQ